MVPAATSTTSTSPRGTTPTSVAIGFSTSQTVRAQPDAGARGWLGGQFQRQLVGHLHERAGDAGTYYGWAMGYAVRHALFTIVGAPITVS